MQLRIVSPAYAEARYPESVRVKDIPLRMGELLVEFKVLKDSTLVWMIGLSQAGATVRAFYKVDRPRDWLEHRILTIRDAFNSGHPEQFDPRTSEEIFGA